MNLYEKIRCFAPELGGVFSYADLYNLIGASSEQKNKRIIRRLVCEETLTKIQRGFYTTQSPDLWVLACRLKKNTYISMDSVLSQNGLIGTLPQKSISVVQVGGTKKNIGTPFGVIRFFSIQKHMAFGIQTTSQGVSAADNEKAYLDLLYFYTKGARFVVDPLSEVNLRKLDRKKIESYLKKYRNPKFVKFIQGKLNENT